MATMLFRRSRLIALVLVAALGTGVGYAIGSNSHSGDALRGHQTSGPVRLAALLQPAKAAPGDPIFMLVPGIPGESTDERHANWIDLNTWSWNVSRGTGAPAFSTVAVTFGVNRALPPLLADLARGTRVPTVTLQAATTGAQPRQIVTITLSGVTFTRASDTSSGGSPSNSLSMSFRQVDYKYNFQRDNGTSQVFDFCWNVAANRGC